MLIWFLRIIKKTLFFGKKVKKSTIYAAEKSLFYFFLSNSAWYDASFVLYVFFLFFSGAKIDLKIHKNDVFLCFSTPIVLQKQEKQQKNTKNVIFYNLFRNSICTINYKNGVFSEKDYRFHSWKQICCLFSNIFCFEICM